MTTDLHKIGIKFFTRSGDDIPLTDFIPVFHEWIQGKLLEDLLIDVADYSHVPDGPGTMLIAHEGNYAVDETGGQRGFLYYSKHQVPGESLADRMITICRKTLAACRLLEADESIGGKMAFDYGRVEIFANDRLQAPNDDIGWQGLEPALRQFAERLYPHANCTVERINADARERLAAIIKVDQAPAAAAALLRTI